MGHSTKKRTPIKQIVTRLALVWGFLLASVVPLTPHVAHAVLPDADDFGINSVKVFRHLLESNDWLLLTDYTIHYATQPEESANQTFIMRVLNGSTVLGINVPYPHNGTHLQGSDTIDNDGYERGFISVYLTAAQFTAQSMTWGAAYTVSLEGNPGFFTTSQQDFHVLASSDYDTGASITASRANLGNYVISKGDDPFDLAFHQILVHVTAIGTVLTASGESYFTGAIIGLRQMAPQIFSVQLDVPVYGTPLPLLRGTPLPTCAAGPSTNCDYPKELQEANDANDVVGGGLDGISSFFGGIGRSFVGMLVGFIFCGVFMGAGYARYQTIRPGLLIAPLMLIMSTLCFGFPFALLAVLTFAAICVIAYTLFFRHG